LFAEISLLQSRISGTGEEGIPLVLVAVRQGGQPLHQRGLPGDEDQFLLSLQMRSVALPVVLILLPAVLHVASQGEMERGVDAFKGFVETLRRDDAVVIVPEDLVDLPAQL